MLTSISVAGSQLTIVDGSHSIPIPGLRDLYRYWTGKKGERLMPRRPDISPIEIVNLLPGIVLIDVEYKPERFRFRLVGTEVVRAMGKDVTGKYLDEISSDRSISDRLAWLARHKRTYYMTTRLDWLGRAFMKYHVLGLPLGDEKGNVNMIMCGIDSGLGQRN